MIRNFLREWRDYGFLVARDNLVLYWVYDFVDAKSMRIGYNKKPNHKVLLKKILRRVV